MVVTFGVDVSHYQGTLPVSWWQEAKAGGVLFGVAKATDGVMFDDPMFIANIAAMRAAGVFPMAYHFLRPGTGASQADYFIAQLRRAGGPAGIGCVLDVESTGDNIVNVSQFIDRFTAATRGQPIEIYTGRWYWHDRMGNPVSETVHPLWNARYPPGRVAGTPRRQWLNLAPLTPSGFSPGYGGWTHADMWQFSDNARIGSVTCDADAYAGTIDQLRALLLGAGGDDTLSQAEVAQINAHTDQVVGKAFASLSHGRLPQEPGGPEPARNGTGIDQLMAELAAVPAAAATAALTAFDPGKLADAIALKLGGSADAATIKAALREALIEGTGGTP